MNIKQIMRIYKVWYTLYKHHTLSIISINNGDKNNFFKDSIWNANNISTIQNKNLKY